MSYRIEVAKTGRATCTQTECKKQGAKIEQDSLRFGIWVEIQGHGSWRWKHWGCVTGKQLENVRAYLDQNKSGRYEWDMLDGYDDEDKGSLHDRPDLQEKVRRVITQGHIDPEDWRGDPEMNSLGSIGLFTSETRKKIRLEQKAREAEAQGIPLPTQADADTPKKKPASKKRARAKEESDEEDAFEESKPAPKKRASKVKVKEELDLDGEPAEVKPKAKRTRKSAVKEEVADGQNGIEAPETKPKAKRGSKRAVKEESCDEPGRICEFSDIEVKPKAKRGLKAVVKEEVVDEQNGVEAPEPKPKTAAKRGRMKAVKKEEPGSDNNVDEDVKGEPGEASTSISQIAPATVKDEVVDEDPVTAAEQPDAEEDQPKKKGGRAKSSLSARSKRSRTASKN